MFEIIDKRKKTVVDFEDLDIGETFFSIGGHQPYIKIDHCRDDNKEEANAVRLVDGLFAWFNLYDEVELITIKADIIE